MGILSALIQGGYVRRVVTKKYTEITLIKQGMIACSLGLFGLSLVSHNQGVLYVSVGMLAFTSGTVVNSLNSLASKLEGDKGVLLGKFRSAGQRGRALGPVCACCAYWCFGSQITNTSGSIFILILYTMMENV